MALIKCPRCELNYIREQDRVCEVCRRAMRGDDEREETPDVCPECGENPAVQGEELCLFCLRERKRQENLEKLADEAVIPDDDITLSNVAEIEEIDVPLPSDDIPPSELQVIDKELGIEGKDSILGGEADEIDEIAEISSIEDDFDDDYEADLNGGLLDDDFEDDAPDDDGESED